MILYIPLSSGQNITHRVLESITTQDLACDIVPCCTDGVYDSNHGTCVDAMAKLEGELKSRNLAINLCSKYYNKEKYVAMQDRDILHLYSDNFLKCVDYLNKDLEVDAVALPWKDYFVGDHIRNAAFVIRANVFMTMTFRIDKRKHICATMLDDLYGRYMFLPSNKKLIEEIIK